MVGVNGELAMREKPVLSITSIPDFSGHIVPSYRQEEKKRYFPWKTTPRFHELVSSRRGSPASLAGNHRRFLAGSHAHSQMLDTFGGSFEYDLAVLIGHGDRQGLSVSEKNEFHLGGQNNRIGIIVDEGDYDRHKNSPLAKIVLSVAFICSSVL